METQHSPQNQNFELDQQGGSSTLQGENQQTGRILTAAQNNPYTELDASQARFAANAPGNPDSISKMNESTQQQALSPSNPHKQPIEEVERGMEPTEAERRVDLLPERMYPIQRPNGVQRINKYAPWSKKAAKKWCLSWNDFAVLPNGSTLKGNQVTPLPRLGQMPAPIDCPWCEMKSETVVTKEMGSNSTLWIVGCCICCGLIGALIPCLCDMGRDTQHFCNNCGMIVAHRDDGATTAQVFGPGQFQTVSKYQPPAQMTPSVPPPVYEESKFAQKPASEEIQNNEIHGKQTSPIDTKKKFEDNSGPRYELQATPIQADGADHFAKDERAKTVEDKERVQAEEMQREKAMSSTGDQHSPVSPPVGSEAELGRQGEPGSSQAAVSPLTK